MKKYNKTCIIMRANPFHAGHQSLIETAFNRTNQDGQVNILLGSAYRAPTVKNPIVYADRAGLVYDFISDKIASKEFPNIKFSILPLPDFLYNNEKWIATVLELLDASFEDDVALITSDKDGDDSKRKEWCPWWDVITCPTIDGLNATNIRNALFTIESDDVIGELSRQFPSLISDPVLSFLKNYVASNEYVRLKNEHAAIRRYNEPVLEAMKQGLVKYDTQYQTADSVVIVSGHILLVKRGGVIGNGLWALPGGFVDKKETSMEAALRELSEETSIDVPPAILKSNIQFCQNFDHPERSNLARLFSMAYIINLPPQKSTAKGAALTKGGKDKLYKGMPKVTAGDDAVDVWWCPYGKFKFLSEQLHDDHYDIGMFAFEKINSFYR